MRQWEINELVSVAKEMNTGEEDVSYDDDPEGVDKAMEGMQ